MEELSIRRSREWLEGVSNGSLSQELEAITLEGLKIIHSQKGFIRCNLVVPSRATDANGNWHLGAMAILIDDVGAAAICSVTDQISASVNFSISFFSTAKAQEEVEIEAKFTEEKGKLSHVVVEVRRKQNRELIALGKQWMIPTRDTAKPFEVKNSKL